VNWTGHPNRLRLRLPVPVPVAVKIGAWTAGER